MAIKGILFDKDGTLLDYTATWMPVNWMAVALVAGEDRALVERLMAVGGYDAVQDRVLPGTPLAAGNTVEIAQIFAAEVPGTDEEALVARLDALFIAEGTKRSVPVDGLKPALETLKGRGFTLGIATSDSERGIRGSLGAFDILHLFEFLCGYDSGHGRKPEPGMVHAFCTSAGLPPGDVAVVGDNAHDMEMGQAAGAGLLVGVLTGNSGREDLEPIAHHVIDSIEGLSVLLD